MTEQKALKLTMWAETTLKMIEEDRKAKEAAKAARWANPKHPDWLPDNGDSESQEYQR